MGDQATGSADVREFPFRFAPAYRWPALPFGIGPGTARVTVSARTFDARFGPWRVTTPLANIAGLIPTGPYRWYRTAGSARYSFADHGLTFATNGDRGLCVAFHEPVAGLEPTGSLRHPSLTVTVADAGALARLLAERTDAVDVIRLHRTGAAGESAPPRRPGS